MSSPSEDLSAALLELARGLARPGEESTAAGRRAFATPFSTTTQGDWAEAVRLWNEHGRKHIKDMPARECPGCGGSERRPLFESYDGYPFVDCATCGCWYVPLRVEAGVFERFFEEVPAARHVAGRTLAVRTSAENARADEARIGGNLDALMPLLGSAPGRRYLDIGCGTGSSLRIAAARGFVASGIESSTACIEAGRRDGLDVRPVTEMPRSGPFELISFWESLEHISDPVAILSHARDLLAERGIVAFTVPNQLAPAVRVQRGDCAFVNGGYDTAGHINLFSPANLERLLARSGLALLDLDGQYGLDLGEIAAYIGGSSRGAMDLLAGEPVASRLPASAMELLASVGPAVAVLERLSLLSPILFGVACRGEAVAEFNGAVAGLRAERASRIEAQVDAAMPAANQVKVLQQRLAEAQRELTETHERLIRSDQENLQIRRALKALRDPLGTLSRLFRGK